MKNNDESTISNQKKLNEEKSPASIEVMELATAEFHLIHEKDEVRI